MILTKITAKIRCDSADLPIVEYRLAEFIEIRYDLLLNIGVNQLRKILYGLTFIFLLVASTLCSAYSYYGPTSSNEHLYRIALRVQPSPQVSIQQIMIAILFANPNAFVNNNINGLKSGYRLHIPPLEAIERIHPLYAINAVNYQNSHWVKNNVRNKFAVRIIKPKSLPKKVASKDPVEDVIPSIEPDIALTDKKVSSSNNKMVKSSIMELAIQQQGMQSADQATLPKPALVNASLEQQSSETSKQQIEISDKLNAFMTDTKKFEEGTKSQLSNLEQQNNALQAKVNALTNQLNSVTYRFMQLTHQNGQEGQGFILLENLRKNAVGLSTGMLGLILITYLLSRSFKSKSKNIPVKEEMSIPSKLDLARAYIDMGDHSAAKSVLQEVLTKGNEEQRKGATDLLGKMNRMQ